MFHTLLYVRVARCDLRIALSQGFLHETQVLRRRIEVRSTTVSEYMAADTTLLVRAAAQDLVDRITDTIPADPCVTVSLVRIEERIIF